tara:strand:- start:439 stop:1056 length:618 start_codon:yes stop_codon:yes gene_type:complete
MDSKAEMTIGLALQEKPDRKRHLLQQLEKHIEKFEIHENKLNTNPFLGCLDSHILAIKNAMRNGYRSVMICEDDIVILDHYHALHLPDTWDMLYFGGILTQVYDSATNGWVQGDIWCAHAYIVKSHLFGTIIDIYESLDRDVMAQESRTIDWLYTKFIHPKFLCYLDESQSIIQKEGHSLLTNKNKWGENWSWSTYEMKDLSSII